MATTQHLEYLFGLELHGVKLGIENIRHLLDAAGRPQGRYTTVHVAGTNGKGSVVALLGTMLRAAGYRVGTFTSPHLIDVTERFLVDARPIPHEALDQQIAFFRPLAEKMDSPPTFFEMNTAIALRWFAECKVDIALIEVGMGGRLDSTNVIRPCASAITNIALEHTRYLGDTVETIAYEKAGIIKQDIPLVIGETNPRVRAILLQRAREMHAPAYVLGKDFRFQLTGESFAPQFAYQSPALRLGPAPLALAGAYQGPNAAVAVALAERLAARYPKLTEQAIATGLKTARWPCRLEKVLDQPPVIIDVAHNPAGALTLARELDRVVTVLAVSADKDAKAIVEALAPITHTFILSQFQGARALPVDALCAAAAPRPHRRAAHLGEALELGLQLAGSSLPLLVTGSIFTAGEARKILIERHGASPLAF